MFEGIRGTNYNADIAVDDITFTQGSCAFTPYAALPPGMSTAAPTPSLTPSRGPTAGRHVLIYINILNIVLSGF